MLSVAIILAVAFPYGPLPPPNKGPRRPAVQMDGGETVNCSRAFGPIPTKKRMLSRAPFAARCLQPLPQNCVPTDVL